MRQFWQFDLAFSRLGHGFSILKKKQIILSLKDKISKKYIMIKMDGIFILTEKPESLIPMGK